MSNKENKQQSMSPNMKNRLRVCSLNSEKRKALGDCTLDLNRISPSPQACSSPKVITIQRKKTQQSKTDQNLYLLSSQKKSRGKAIKTETIQKKTQSSEQFQKLLQITSRCVDYYNKFLQIKDSELKVVRQAFADIHESLSKAFNGIITEVNNKHNEIKQFLQKKQKQLIDIKENQQTELNSTLNDVKSVHLVNLLRDYKTADQSADLGQQICNYANTLHKFYESMEKVERQNFKQGVDETINFINNIITEEIKFIIYQKIPSKSLNGSFSFNDGLGFGNSISSALQHKIQNDTNNEASMVSENSIQSSLTQKLSSKRKQVKESWTQTLCQNSSHKISMLGTINEITKRQFQMKEKIEKYLENSKF